MLEFLKRITPCLVVTIVFALGWHFGANDTEANWKEKVHNEYVTKVEATEATQARVNEVSSKYQEDYAALEGSTDRVIDDLHNSNKRLRVQIKPASGQLQSDGGCITDGPVELHESTSRSLIAITQKADLKEKALQDTIRKLLQQPKEK